MVRKLFMLLVVVSTLLSFGCANKENNAKRQQAIADAQKQSRLYIGNTYHFVDCESFGLAGMNCYFMTDDYKVIKLKVLYDSGTAKNFLGLVSEDLVWFEDASLGEMNYRDLPSDYLLPEVIKK